MQDFKSIFQEKTQGFFIYPRRFGIQEGKTHLYGPPKSGKTSLALLYAKNYKYPVYIHCEDPRIHPKILAKELFKAFLENHLDLLILDHYQPFFELPHIKNIILITNKSTDYTPENFKRKAIDPLIFEEYISITKNHISINQLLNLFIKDGNLPEIFNTPDHLKITRKQELMQRIFKDDFDLFCSLLLFQSQNITIHQIYTQLKRSIKISKDKLYLLFSSLENQNFIHFLPQKDIKNTAKKLYFYDFSLPYAFSPEPSFQAIFENMVFLELRNQAKSPIYAHSNAHFLIQELLVFAIAFPNAMILDRIAQRNPKQKILVIAINPLYHPYCKVIDFITFALQEYQEEV